LCFIVIPLSWPDAFQQWLYIFFYHTQFIGKDAVEDEIC
jgi:hypothetical protein